MPTLAEHWLNEGRDKGRAEGRDEGLSKGRAQGLDEGLSKGRTEGQRETLRKLLAEKFGVLTDSQRARIESATPEELAQFVARILSADTVDAVLAPTP